MQRSRLFPRFAAAVAWMVLAACAGPESDGAAEVEEARYEGAEIDVAELPAPELARARETADDLTRDLGGLLLSTMEAEGALAAVEVCSSVAQERTAAHARAGVDVRRVSSRIRNPLNAPDASEARELERLEGLARENRTPGEVVRLVRRGEERTLHYLRPIMVAAPCTACHGSPETIDPAVMAVIRESYPDDQATGYDVGDLRGAVSVRVSLPPGR
jgi:hypothetical protein